MKIRMLPLAIASAMAAPGVVLAAGPTVYGKLNVAYGMSDVDYGYESIDPNSADRWDLTSYDSRVGVSGDAAINDSLSAIYQIEWGVNVAGDEADMSQRDRFVGLKGGFGTVRVGKFDTPLKKAQGKIDLFGDTSGDIKYVLVGENRVNNILQYSSPDMGGLQANVAFMPGEEYETETDGDAKDGPADAFSLSLTYTMDGIYAAVAHDSEVSSRAYESIGTDFDLDRTAAADMDVTRLVAVVNLDAFQVGALYQMAETSDADVDGDVEQDGYVLSASFKIDAVKLKAQWGASTISDNDADVDTDAELLALGADYGLSKQTNLYVHYTMASYEEDTDGAEEQTADKLDFGIVHQF